MTDALRVVNAAKVRDEDGQVVGWWAGRFISTSDYPQELQEAEAQIESFEE